MKLYHGQYRLECMECDLATLLVEKRGLTLRKALSVLYDSEIYRLLQKPNTGLFFQSPHYVYSYLQEEIDKGKYPITSKHEQRRIRFHLQR